jgi:hypothetical protein
MYDKGVYKQMTGIDVSEFNGCIDLTKRKPDFVLIRLGVGDNVKAQDDSMFLANVKKAESAGDPWGAYIFSYANTSGHIESEVNHCKRMLRGLKPSFPIYIDCESKELRDTGRTKATVLAAYFCELMKNAGYLAGCYFNKDWLENHLYYSKLWDYPAWYSRPGSAAREINAGIVQTGIDTTGSSWSGCNTASGYCDVDECTVDYPAYIKSHGLNGWTKTTEVKPGVVPEYYVVKRGDSMWSIAVQHSTSVDVLKRLNPSIADCNTIYAGTKVRVK